MKKGKILALTVITCSLLCLAGGVGLIWAQGPHLGASVGTAFTYQGRLVDEESPATGTYDFLFSLHDHPTAYSQVGSTIQIEDEEVTDGLFTVQLDFGSGVFTGEARYLEIGVRPGEATSPNYTTLAPRQELTAAPYALYSLSTGSLQGYPVSDTIPSIGQLLQWNGSAWEPATAASGNQPPVAVLQADLKVLMPSATTTFSLALSYDPDGGPLTYAFDPTGETLGAPTSYGSTSTTTVSSADFSAPGNYLAAGWVKDASGAFAMARTLVSVYNFWNTIADSTGSVGSHASLAVVAGRPAIAYRDGTNDDLKYVWANDAAGFSWGSSLTADSVGDVGQYASLAVVDGNPAIAYYDATNEALKYVRSTNSAGSYWPPSLTLDNSTFDAGKYASMAIVDGRPAIAYYEEDYTNLKYVRASDSTGSSWPPALFVPCTGDVGKFASLAVVDGNPAIAYYEETNHDLQYVRATNTTGTAWGTPVIVDSTGDVGWYASLAVVESRPAIAYRDYTNGDLKYARANDTTGSSWGTPVTVDSAGSVGWYASLAVVDGNPAIAYQDFTNDDLKYVRASDATGSSWSTPITVDSVGDVGRYASLAVVGGRPAIAYSDNTNDDLRFAIPRPY